jgi:putative transposase
MRRELAEWAQQAHDLSQRRAAGLIPVDRATLRYEHHRDPQDALRVRLRELAGSRVRYGYRRLTVMLKREGWEVNAKRIYRLYTEEGLIVRTRSGARRERSGSECRKGRQCAGTTSGAWISWRSDCPMAAGSAC